MALDLELYRFLGVWPKAHLKKRKSIGKVIDFCHELELLAALIPGFWTYVEPYLLAAWPDFLWVQTGVHAGGASSSSLVVSWAKVLGPDYTQLDLEKSVLVTAGRLWN